MELVPNSEIRGPLHVVRCFGELALFSLIQFARTVDDAIVELGDDE